MAEQERLGTVREPCVVLLLSCVTLGIYWLWWYYTINKEILVHAPRSLNFSPGMALASQFVPIAGFVSHYNTAKRIQATKAMCGDPDFLSPGAALVFSILLPVGIYTYMLQTAMNNHWHHHGLNQGGETGAEAAMAGRGALRPRGESVAANSVVAEVQVTPTKGTAASPQGGSCEKCGAPWQEEDKFCGGCGTPAPPPPEPKVERRKPEPHEVACSKCGQIIPAGNRFCGGCGTPAPPPPEPQPVACSKCGQLIPARSRFCGNCGAPASRPLAQPERAEARLQALVCGKCGQPLPAASRFCDTCGAPLT